MRAGRKPQGVQLIDGLEGDARAKRALKVFLKTLSGECTVDEACQELDLAPSWFFEWRNRWLQESLDLLAPRKMGRPAQPQAPGESRAAQLEEELQKVQAQLAAANLRAALAGGGSHAARQDDQKKGARSRRRKRPRLNR
jgi:hypothetical protein